MMGKINEIRKKKKYLILSLCSNLGLLFAFKYYNFFALYLNKTFSWLDLSAALPHSNFLLPVGISFYTFQTIGYSIDVYYGRIKPEKHLGIYSLYVAFFSQLVAGPIERAGNLIHQFKKHHEFDYQRVTSGLKLMMWGFFKKIVIADRLAVFADQVYNQPLKYNGASFIIGTVFFAFQIYCDFSGYSDIAIGSARVLGYRLMDNFKTPYLARSIEDFWKRWHISLSLWFRDHLYIPLGGNRVSKFRWVINIAITFLLSGLWHGADWTFLIWGGLHGLFLILSRAAAHIRNSICSAVGLNREGSLMRMAETFLTFTTVCFAWIFFRAESISDAWYIITHLNFGFNEFIQEDFIKHMIYLNQLSSEFWIAISLIVFLISTQFIEYKTDIVDFISNKSFWFRWVVYIAVSLMVMNIGITHEIPFVYFQF
ncbi:MAG: MBOAT family O-acyltransferase [bacterium]